MVPVHLLQQLLQLLRSCLLAWSCLQSCPSWCLQLQVVGLLRVLELLRPAAAAWHLTWTRPGGWPPSRAAWQLQPLLPELPAVLQVQQILCRLTALQQPCC